MKKFIYVFIGILCFGLFSCKNCKTCKHPFDPTTVEKVCEGNLSTQEYNELIEQKEDMGYVCN